MATVINNPGPGSERVVERTDAGAGWAVAIVLIVLALIALFVWPGFRRTATPGAPNTGTTNVNVTTPPSGTGGSGTTGGSGASTGGTGAGSGSVSGSASGAASGGTGY